MDFQICSTVRFASYNDRLDHPAPRPTVERVLRCMSLLLKEADELTARYVLRRDRSGVLTTTENRASVSQVTFARINARIIDTHLAAGLPETIRWVIVGQKKFKNLVQDPRELIDYLPRRHH